MVYVAIFTSGFYANFFTFKLIITNQPTSIIKFAYIPKINSLMVKLGIIIYLGEGAGGRDYTCASECDY